MKRHAQKSSGKKRAARELPLDELKAIIARSQAAPLTDEDRDKLDGAIDTLAVLTLELEKKGASIRRLRHLLFGARTEKTSKLFGSADATDAQASGDEGAPAQAIPDAAPADGSVPAAPAGASTGGAKRKRKVKGHGRNGAADYPGAERVAVPHPTLQRGQVCPDCAKGKLYPLKDPAVLVRITGMAPFAGKLYECERVRCNLCGKIYTAPPPDGVGTAKYDESAPAMVGLLKYGTGLPWNRLEKVQQWVGVPLPASTQWELVREAEPALAPVFDELVRQAAQGQVVHNDDTTMKVLELLAGAEPFTPQAQERAAADDGRTGVYTTGIVSLIGPHRAALFFTGPRHAGENLESVLKQRAAALAPPIQMSDSLSHNTAGDFETIVASCLVHARRYFVDVVQDFPEECRYVIEALRKVYRHEAATKKLGFSDDERLAYHQQVSKPIMDELELWLAQQLDEKRVEPNSGLGEAIKHMQKHWDKLTLFLRVPGAPLDNSIVERALKKAVLHRKNSLFYKTLNGARVGDTFMSLIHTTELNGGDPFHYLVSLLKHAKSVAEHPGDWLPWNYRDTLARTTAPAASNAAASTTRELDFTCVPAPSTSTPEPHPP